MNKALEGAAFQSQLAKYATFQTPPFWPDWLIVAGVLLAGMLVVLALHAVRRQGSSPPPAGEPVYLYPMPVRAWHWTNATLYVLLLCSGLVNHFALASAKATAFLTGFHVICGFLLAGAWAAFILINLATGNGRHYLIHLQGLPARMTLQAKYYLSGIFRGEPHPFHADAASKFNPLQQVAYVGVVYALMPLLLITGLLCYGPEWLGGSLGMFRHSIFVIHQLLSVASLFFIFGHLYLCTTGRTPTETFRAMVDGYHR